MVTDYDKFDFKMTKSTDEAQFVAEVKLVQSRGYKVIGATTVVIDNEPTYYAYYVPVEDSKEELKDLMSEVLKMSKSTEEPEKIQVKAKKKKT